MDHFEGLTALEVMVKHWHYRNGHPACEGAAVCHGCEHEMRDVYDTLDEAGFVIVRKPPKIGSDAY